MAYRVIIVKEDGTQKTARVEEPNLHELMKGLQDDLLSFIVSREK